MMPLLVLTGPETYQRVSFPFLKCEVGWLVWHKEKLNQLSFLRKSASFLRL